MDYIYEYSDVVDEWALIPGQLLGVARGYCRSVLLANTIYIIGGVGGGNVVDVFDAVSKAVSTGTPLPHSYEKGPAVAVINHSIVIWYSGYSSMSNTLC
jgi:hypothetical protein